MQVDAVIPGNAYGLQNPHRTGQEPEAAGGPQDSSEVPEPSVTTAQVSEQELENGEDTKGVSAI